MLREHFLTSSKIPQRNRIPLEHRDRIVRAFEDEEEHYLLVVDTLGLNRSTARGIVARYIREGRIRERQRGGTNKVRVDDEMRDCLEEIINGNCLITLTQINHDLRRKLPLKPEIHDRTVSMTLDGMLSQVRLARPLPADRNRSDVLNKRVDYATWFMKYAELRHCVFVDECGFNIWTARSHGRARQGERERAYRQVCGQRGRNFTLTMAISLINGLVFSFFFEHRNYMRLCTEILTRLQQLKAQWYLFMQTYLPKCLNREVIEGKLKFIRK